MADALGHVLATSVMGPVHFEIKRGLLRTLEDARKYPQLALQRAYAALMDEPLDQAYWDVVRERVVLHALQVDWYREIQGQVPTSIGHSFGVAKERARIAAKERQEERERRAELARKNFHRGTR